MVVSKAAETTGGRVPSFEGRADRRSTGNDVTRAAAVTAAIPQIRERMGYTTRLQRAIRLEKNLTHNV